MSARTCKLGIAAVLLVPTLCCFVGIGALLNVLVSVVNEQEQKQADACAEYEQQRDLIAELKKAIERTSKRIATLQGQLDDEANHAELVAQVEAEIRRLREELAKRQAELAKLQEQLTDSRRQAEQSRNEVDEMESQAADARDDVERARQEAAQAQQSAEQRKREAGEKEKAAAEARAGLLGVLGGGSPDGNAYAAPQDIEDEIDRQQGSLAEAEKKRDELADQLDELRRQIKDEEQTFDITTLQGSYRRTNRKPVFVECDAFGIRIQPAGTRLGTWPSEQEKGSFLAAAKRTWYVVFLIRPAGFQAFNQYRAVVEGASKGSQWKIEYGYEPINADWNLRFPK